MRRCTCPQDRTGGCNRCTARIDGIEWWLEYGHRVDTYGADRAADRYERAMWAALEGS